MPRSPLIELTLTTFPRRGSAIAAKIVVVSVASALLTLVSYAASWTALLVQGHPQAGVEILEVVPLLTPALDVVGAHHERYDGGGYPQGLKAEEIPLSARIFAVADALDAMTHDRPYRPAGSLDAALAVLKQEAGRQFDPRIVEAALAIEPARWRELLDAAA